MKKLDIEGQQIGWWEVLYRIDSNRCMARCVCGKEKPVYISHLKSGQSSSCGCMNKTKRNKTMEDKLKKEDFGEWTVIKKLSDGTCLCRCSCGTERVIHTWALRAGKTKSCGHSKLVYSTDLRNEIAKNCEYNSSVSRFEHELDELFPGSTRNKMYVTKDGKKYQLDLLFENKGIAIEFNGDYWHEVNKKGKNYHWDKTRAAEADGVRLIHIFEYEWLKDKEKMIKYINKELYGSDIRVGARDCILKELTKEELAIFEKANHLQNSANSSVKIGLIHDGRLVMSMSFGQSRFSDKYQYELIRFTSGDCIVHGGAEKMFKHFIGTYKPKSIVSYCDRSKFTGEIYSKLNFKLDGHSEPNYKWVKHNGNGETLNRMQTQKHKLIEQGLGKFGDTEDEIMRALGYFKVYDCGNDRYVFRGIRSGLGGRNE